MEKVITISALAMAGVFSAQILANENKTNFCVTGRAGASVMSLSEQRFVDGGGARADKYKGGDKNDTVFGASLAVGYDFYQHCSVSVRTEAEFYGRDNAEPEYRLSYWGSVGGAKLDDARDKLSVNTLILNAYYDFRNSSAFALWISVGLGYVRIHHKTSCMYTNNSLADSEICLASASKYENNLAQNLGVDVKCDMMQDFNLDLNYWYLGAGDSTLAYKDESGAKYKSSVGIRSNEFMLGTTYGF